MTFKNFNELIQSISKDTSTKVVAVAMAEDRNTLEAACRAFKNNIAVPVLVGDKAAILKVLESLGEEPAPYKIIDAENETEAAKKAVALVRTGEADFLMKGKIHTAALLHEVVDKENGLHAGGNMSMMAFFELPGYHKLISATDGGMIMYPDLEDKRQIIQNAVGVYHALGVTSPKVAVLAAVEVANPKMPEAMDGAALKQMNQRGEIAGCIVEGPISYDLAMSRKAAELKCFDSPVCGDADILVVPDIATGNILGKALVVSAGATMAGFVVGAKAPIALTSRGSSAQDKYLSLVLSAAAV